LLQLGFHNYGGIFKAGTGAHCAPDKKYCETDNDCVCGGFDTDGSCFMGNKLYYNEHVDKTGICPDFCGGFGGNLVLKCVDSQCKQIPR